MHNLQVDGVYTTFVGQYQAITVYVACVARVSGGKFCPRPTVGRLCRNLTY